MPPGPATAIRQVRAFLADADPARYSGADAANLVNQFAELGRLAKGGETLFAARAVDSNIWIHQGHDSAASWLAEQTQGPMGEAISTIETSRRLQALPDTTDALRSGELSGAQVREVARAADKDPSTEGELLELAGNGSLKRLKDRARQVLAQAASKEDELARYRAIYEHRYLRTFTDHLGAFRLDARLTPDAGARLLESLQAEADAQFEQACQGGTRQSAEAYRADALVALVTGHGRAEPPSDSAKRTTGRADVVCIRVDATALRRGFVADGELCEVAGVGPVPVAAVNELLPQAFVKTLIRDGVDVLNVCHIGRAISTHLVSALEEHDPTCVVPDCAVAHGLENHHWQEDFAKSGLTSLKCLARVCKRHHDLITYSGFILEGGPGKWTFRAPPDVASGGIFDDTG